VKEYKKRRDQDEPPDKVQNSESDHRGPGGSKHPGFCFGDGRYFVGLVALCLQVAVSLADGFIWFWVLENMKDRMDKQQGAAKA
jgi:hypothetical protein